MTDAWSLQRSSTFEILTPRLRLRPMRMDDAADIWQMRRRGENRKFDKGNIDTTLDKTEAWLRDKVLASHTVVNFSIEWLDSSAYLTSPPEWKGQIPAPPFESIEPSPDSEETLPKCVIGVIGIINGPEVGYMMHPAYQGQGIASEALKGMIEWFWEWWPVAPPATLTDTLPPENSTPDAVSPDDTKNSTEQQSNAAADSRDLLATSNTASNTAGVSTNNTNTPIGITTNTTDTNPTSNATPSDPWPQPSHGTNYIQADTDPENYASHSVLRKCGFTLWSLTYDDFYSELLGMRGTIMFRLARPGTQLARAPYETVQVEERERREREAREALKESDALREVDALNGLEARDGNGIQGGLK